MTVRQLIERSVLTTLAILVLADCSMLFYLKQASKRLAIDTNNVYNAADSSFPMPQAFAANGTPLRLTKGRGWVVRFASSRCSYCKVDEARWTKLSKDLKERGYQTLVITPTVGDLYSSDHLTPADALQGPFVQIDWIRKFKLIGTPTLLIFGSDGKLIWSHAGTLGSFDEDSAKQALDRVRTQ